MIYLYGGAFVVGTGEMYPGEILALEADVIVININYRLGIFGWMSTGTCNIDSIVQVTLTA